MKKYKIFPSIGIGRLGEDEDFFIAPEVPGTGPTELSDGTPVARFKNAAKTKIRKQAARFHLFESDDGSSWVPIQLPVGAKVTWRTALANKKSAVTRPGDPPIRPMRPDVPDANRDQLIEGGTKTISGANAHGVEFGGRYKTTASDGSAYEVDVPLGGLRTDDQGRLLVLGGTGFSSAPPGTPIGPAYYRNPHWHDDVSDGPVEAEIDLGDGQPPVKAENGAWVIIAPPDYAPDIMGVVTLYDVLTQVGIDNFGASGPQNVSFDLHVAPILARVRKLRWVNDDANWSDPSLSNPSLRSRAPAQRPLRATARDAVLATEGILEGHTDPRGPKFLLRPFQKAILEAWVQGNADETPAIPSTEISADGLTRAALEGAVGQGFCPGIEAGIILLDPQMYARPFDYRIDHAGVNAGDLTALMAQPWQADFLKCNTNWWPSQRPDIAPQADGSNEDWIRGANRHLLLVQRSNRLGFIVRRGADEVFVEAERDPALGAIA